MSHLRHPNPNFTGFAFDGDSLFFYVRDNAQLITERFRVEEAFP